MNLSLTLHGIVGLISFVCYIMVIMQMFQHNQAGLGVACLVGFILCGIGVLFAFIYGWMKSSEWNINNVMLVWTAAFVAELILYFVAPISIPGLPLPGR
jgi:hypothetical protein